MNEYFMEKAIEKAREALKNDDVPVGAVITHGDKIIAASFNNKVLDNNPLGHAEINAIYEASEISGKLYLSGMTLYVTLEPCLMCAGAIILSRLPRLVYGCADRKAGAFGSLYDMSKDERLNHRIEVVKGICETECREILLGFFKKLRCKG